MHREHTSILCEPIHGKHVRSTDLAFYTSTPSDLDDCWTHICTHACLHAHEIKQNQLDFIVRDFFCDLHVSSNSVRFPTQSDSKRHQSPATLHESLSLLEGLNF